MGDIFVHLISNNSPPNTGDHFDLKPCPKESNFQSSDPTTSGKINDHKPILRPTIVSGIQKPVNTPRDRDTSSNFGSVLGGDMSDSDISRHSEQRHSRNHRNSTQRRSAPHFTHPSATHAHSLPPSPHVPFQNTQNRSPTNFPVPSLHYSTSPPPHGHGGAYISQYTMSPQPTPMGVVHSPPSPYGFPHAYHHPIGPDIIPQNSRAHQSLSQHPQAGPVYQYQRHSRQGNSALHFMGTGPTPMYPTHQANTLGPPSPHPTSVTVQNSPLSPSYVGSGVFHSLQHSSHMSTPHYTYSPPFPGTPPYQSQYPPQFTHYAANRDGEPQGDWYYVPRPSPLVPSQQYDASPSYSGHYSTAYPQIRPELNDSYNASSFSSANTSTPYLVPPIHSSSQRSESLSSEILRGSMPHSASLSSSIEHLPSDKPIVRRSYHPNPPPHRSDWVMWTGNIPSDATHDEIYRFFSQVPEDKASEPTSSTGVVSVFLISRSNCAFINFESESCLLQAISRCNGIPLRAGDARCARLVCRVRRKDDDLKAGVGGQRGVGIHTRWVEEQKHKAQEETKHDQSDFSASDHCSTSTSTSPSSIPEQLANEISNFPLSSDDLEMEQDIHAKRSSTSESYSSSNSNFLARHFPKRYFILKSLTQHDLDLSVQTGFWATQKHNEGVLDQSYRTSKDVYLIFGANKSGEFYGYARMAGPVRRGGQNIPWCPSPPRSNQSPISGRLSSGPIFFSPGDHRLVDSSPSSLDGPHTKTATDLHPGQQHPPHKHPQSAPGMLGPKYDLPAMKTPEVKHSLDQQQTRFKGKNPVRAQNDDFDLDPLAPVRAMRSSARGKSRSRGTSLHSLEEKVEEPDEVVTNVQEPHEQEEKHEYSWGDCFAVEWISTEKLPFNRTKQIRNPWNHDREVKVSRDGTELEPTIGQKLLDEWHKLSEPREKAG